MADRTLELLIRLAGENASLKATIAGSQRDLGQLGRGGAQAGQQITRGMDSAVSSLRRLAIQAGAGFLTFQGLRSIVGDFIRTAGDFERLRVQLASLMGTAEQGEAAFAWLQEFAENTPFQLQDLTQSFIRLKAFGMDPMNGTMQAIADQSALLGGSQETLNGIVLALGQAWAKQKLQGEEILQLVERGVPVWELLADVTGRTAEEVQELSAKGALGRDVIAGLIDAMGRRSSGAAIEQMSTFTGMVSNAQDTWDRFLDTIAQSGALDEVKRVLDGVLGSVTEAADSGELEAFAQQVASGFGTLIGLGRDAAAVVASLSGELKILAELWVAGKILAYTDGLRQMMVASTAARQETLALATTQRAAADSAAVAASAAARQAESALLFRQMRVAEAQAAVQAASGLDRLAVAQNQLLPAQAALRDATQAHNAALANQVRATRASSAALTAQGAAARAASVGFVTLSGVVGAFGSIVTSIPILLTMQQVGRLLAVIADHRDAVRGMADAQREFERAQRQTMAANEEAAQTALLPAAALRRATRDEQDAYAERLRDAEAFWRARFELEARQNPGGEAARQANIQVRRYREALAQIGPILDERQRQEAESADRIAALKKEETDRIVAELDRQKEAYDEATRALDQARKQREDVEREFAQFVDQISRPSAADREPTFLDATFIRFQAEQALQAGDTERAIELAREAAEAVRALRDESGGSLALTGLARQIQQVATTAAAQAEAAAEQQAATIRATIEDLTARAKVLESLKVGFDDAQAITDAQALRAALEAELAANPITVKVQLDAAGQGAQLIEDAEVVTPPGRALGGLIPGSSPTPTADNVLIRATAGEYMQPVAAVRRYGLDVMEALRAGRVAPERIQRAIRGYAQGGLISPALATLPPVPSAAAVAPGPAGGQPMGVLVLQADGRSYRATMPVADADELMRSLHHEALKTGARKPR